MSLINPLPELVLGPRLTSLDQDSRKQTVMCSPGSEPSQQPRVGESHTSHAASGVPPPASFLPFFLSLPLNLLSLWV